jgi:hypothetical protein
MPVSAWSGTGDDTRLIMRLPNHFCIYVLLLLLPRAVSAQSSGLAGRVTDPSGAAIVGAVLTLTNLATGGTSATETNASGLYLFPAVAPGRYRLTIGHPGFRTVVRDGVVVHVGTTTTEDARLDPGEVKETVEIVGRSPIVDRQSGSVGTTVDRRDIANLPLNGRSFQSLLELVPGVVFVEPSLATGVGQFSVNGQRSNANYFLVDGVSANAAASFSATSFQQAAGSVPGLTTLGSTQSLVSVDALEEFRMLTSTFAPEHGRTPGGQVSLVTRSGANRYTGTLFDYLRNDALDANDWFNNRAGRAKLPLRQNQFGGTLGGPLSIPKVADLRDRAFFFLSYEGMRLRQPQPEIRSVLVPTLEARGRVTGAARQLLEAFPHPNAPALSGDATDMARYEYRISYPSSFDATSLRGDIRLGTVNLFSRFATTPSSYEEFVFANQKNVFSADNTTWTTGITWAKSTALLSETRINYSRSEGRFDFVGREVDGAILPPPDLLFPAGLDRERASASLQLITGANTTSLTQGKSLANNQEQLNLVSTLTWVHGDHAMKGGVDWRRLRPITDFREASVSYGVGGVTPFVETGRLAQVSVQALAPTTTFTFDNLSVFLQDTWRATPRFTMTYGARWELNPPPSGDRLPYTFTDVNNLLTAQLAPAGTPLWQTSYGNVAPRMDVAYVLADESPLIVRGGAGVFYDLGNSPALRGYSSYPFNTSRVSTSVPFPVPADVLAPPSFLSDTPPITAQFYVFDPNLALPYTIQWNASVERGLGDAQSVTASYVGARGERLLRLESLRNRPANAAAGIPEITYVNPALVSTGSTVFVTRNAADSNYNALQLQFQRRLSRGVQALAAYTLSSSTDTVSSEAFMNVAIDGVPGFEFDPEAERGPSDFDIRHVLSGAFTWDLPSPSSGLTRALAGGWGIDVMGRFRSAPPLHVIATDSDPLNAGSNRRVDLVPGVDPWVVDPTAPGGKRLNRAAFAAPTPGHQGTMGRNSLRWIGAHQIDFSLRRTFTLIGSARLQMRGDVFNLFNTANFDAPDQAIDFSPFGVSTQMLNRALGPGGTSGGLSPLYQIGGPRSVQLSMKVLF